MKSPLSLIALLSILCVLDALNLNLKKDKDGILDDNDFDEFTKFRSEFGKPCGDAEADCKKRKENFAKNLKKFKDLQKKHSESKEKLTFTIKMHPQMDWSEEELQARLMKMDSIPELNKEKKVPGTIRTKRSIPSSFDWRVTGTVPAVRDQGSCGDCWAFAATASVEILDNLVNCRTTSSTWRDLSEQLALDCTYYNASLPQSQQRNGCNGGWPKEAYSYFIKSGITSEAAKPYKTTATYTCPSTLSPKYNPIRDYWDLTGNVAGMVNYIATTAPITIAMWVCADFSHYGTGILNTNCGPNANRTNGHAMAAIGYGTENGQDYWLVRNSWGPSWGDAGYIKIKRGVDLANIESWGVSAPVPTVPASECATYDDEYYLYSDCDCTPVITSAPKAPYSPQTQPGQSGCVPNKISLNCPGSGKDAIEMTLYDDAGKQIYYNYYCYSWTTTDSFYNWTASCQTTTGGTFQLNYPIFNGSRVAYQTCKNNGPIC